MGVYIYTYICGCIYIYNCSSVPIFFQIQLDILRFCVRFCVLEALVDYMRHAAALMLEKPLGTDVPPGFWERNTLWL